MKGGLDHPTLAACFWARANAWGNQVLLRQKELGVWNELTWSEAASRVRQLATGLLALGATAGRTTAIVSGPRRDWLLVDLAAQGAGLSVAGIDPHCTSDELARHLAECNAEVVVVEDGYQLQKIRQAVGAPGFRLLVVLDPDGLTVEELRDTVTLAQVVAAGAQGTIESTGLDRLAGGDVAAFVYTLGGSGQPRPVALTNERIVAACRALGTMLDLPAGADRAVFQNMSHYAERIAGVYQGMLAGHILNFVEAPETALADLREIQPAVLIASARVWSELRSAVLVAMHEATPLEKRLYAWALAKNGAQRAAATGSQATLQQWLRRTLSRGLVLKNLLRSMGVERTRYAIVAGTAPTGSLLGWFHSMGVPLREAWGMAEAAGIAAVGEVGSGPLSRPLPGVGLGRSDEGELTLATELDGGTTLASGDLVEPDGRGGMRLVGRRQECFRLASGEFINPAVLENALRESDVIDGATVIGDGLPFACVLIGLNAEAIRRWAQRRAVSFSDFSSLVGAPAVQELLAGEMRRANAAVAPGPQLRRFHVFASAFHHGDEELSALGSYRRDVMLRKHAAAIRALYEDSTA